MNYVQKALVIDFDLLRVFASDVYAAVFFVGVVAAVLLLWVL